MSRYEDPRRGRPPGGTDRQGYRQGRRRTNQSGRSRPSSRYYLRYPGRLAIFVALLVIMIVVIISCRNKNQNKQAEEESQTSIETMTAKKEVETGTVRPVSAVTLDSVGTQITTYMASMIYSNPTNYKRTSSKPNEETPDTEVVDLSHYRYVVAINANAGGANNGWVEGEAIEKTITLSVAKQMVDWLNTNSTGYYFMLVRSSDTTMTDSARLSKISNYAPDLLITLACNGSDLELGGVIATCYTAPTEYYDDEQEDPKPKSERDRYTEALAQKLMEECADGFNMWWRDLQYEDGPLLETEYPSVKVYMGFLTYYLDNEKVLKEDAQAQAALKMGRVILDFCDAHAPEKTRGQLAGEALMGGNSESSSSSEESSNQESSVIQPAYQPAYQNSGTSSQDTDDEDEWDEEWDED